MGRLIRALAGIGLVCLAGPAVPDVDDSAYDTASQRVSPAARRAIDAQLAQERQREEERERLEREEAAREEAARQAALAARPYPVRLLEKRCTVCHSPRNYLEQTHTLPGWWAVVLRMKYLNKAGEKAGVELAEVPVLAAHLTEIRGATGPDAWVEYAVVTTVLAVPLAGGWWLRRRAIRRRALAAISCA